MKKILCAVLAVFLWMVGCPRAAYAAPSLSARAAVLMEASTGQVLMESAAHERLPMASTTKIMTALVALEHADLSQPVHISEKAVGVEGSSVYLKAGEILTMEQLLCALMLESANDAAAAIAIEIAGNIESFADLMNETAQRIGLTDTHFTNPHGLDNADHYSSAYDLAMLARYALQNPDFARIVSTYKTNIPLGGDEGIRVLINHNKMLKYYDGAIGVKTGYTKRCGRCLVSAATRDGVTMIAVTLSAPDDWRDHTAMLDYGFSLYECAELAQPGQIRCALSCLGSTTEYVSASNRDGVSLILPREHGEITHVIEANRYLCAPVMAGDTVGEIVFFCDGTEIARTPLYAEEDADALPRPKGYLAQIKEFITPKK